MRGAGAGGGEEGGAGGAHRQGQGEDRQRDVVADWAAGIETQHGDEVHRPDAGAHGDRRRRQPDATARADVGVDPPEEVEGRPGAEYGHDQRQDHED
ncbi:hypothetical protein LRS10_19955 [Phenylobacterium sp. J426]|nr:hypothetical protein [Phenylobacterium sp. J426]MCR5876216.1 hypothetical protein [Phenylobacterium sp. J426]